MPALGAGTAWQTVLADAAAIGFAGIELGAAFPADADAMAGELARHRLSAIGQWYGCRLLERTAAAEIEALAPQLDRLAALGAPVLIVAEVAGAIHRDRTQRLANRPRLDDAAWPGWGERLTRLAEHVAARGLRLAYHPHLGTIVEDAADLERLVAVTGAAVGLTLDTGHAARGGIDPVAAVRAHPARIAHVHAKDVRTDVAADAGQRSFLDNVLAGLFAPPGGGALEFGPLAEALAAVGYAGWIVVEAEQDPARADPRAASAAGLAALRAAARAAGLAETARA